MMNLENSNFDLTEKLVRLHLDLMIKKYCFRLAQMQKQ